MQKQRAITDGNEAAASVAYRLSETIAIYPITPSSNMAEHCDEWASKEMPNLWKTVPEVTEMQSEAGAAGTVHGLLQGGTLTTTFTASQGLLLMIPNMYKIAGELTSFAMHVSARALATHALSIFGDHSDVMACRQTGFALLASNNVQEAHDMAAVAHAATLEARIPFLHFFDGFRTSHEVNTYEPLSDETLAALVSQEAIDAHRQRALTPDAPVVRGTAQNPDVFFQAREASNLYYERCPGIVQEVMDRFAKLTGRQYKVFEYTGAADAESVVIAMGSGVEPLLQTSAWLNSQGKKTGVLNVRLFRPWDLEALISVLPKTVRQIAVLDRCKESGAIGEPLYLDMVAALEEARMRGLMEATHQPMVIGGIYGLGSKEFNPAMAKAVFDELEKEAPRNHFTVGIVDDVTHRSLEFDPAFDIEPEDGFRGVFIGLGSDGTVGANKNSIKIIGEETDNFAQAYFVYDSKKSGGMTISHLRFGPKPVRSPYLITNAQFLGCHQWQYLEQIDILKYAAQGATLLLNSPYGPDKVWDHLPREVQAGIREKDLKLYVIDAYTVSKAAGMRGRINTIMQTAYFAISGILPADEAIAKIKAAIDKTYGKKGRQIVEMNFAAVDAAVDNLHQVKEIPTELGDYPMRPAVAAEAPDFVQKVTAVMLKQEGDSLPVSAFPVDGTWPTDTSRWEKRNIAREIPLWDAEVCIQCSKCVFVCPHAAIRAKAFPADSVNGNCPEGFQTLKFRSKELENHLFSIQVAPEDCTGCGVCVTVCPAKNKAQPKLKAVNMAPHDEHVDREKVNYDYFLSLPDPDPQKLKLNVKESQLRRPLFEYSGACAGCGETPYVKLLSQLFGDRLLIANATGCSSIYGGNLPTTPFAQDCAGRGPAWSNSLFEDNAEFGFGLRLAVDKKAEIAALLLKDLAPQVGDDLVASLLNADQSDEAGISEQRARVKELQGKLAGLDSAQAKSLTLVADYLVKKSVWCLGGDGWAYDIGFGGLDHVIASGRNINILVMDTEVYSNTGGQASKSTPFGSVAKFAAAGKATGKKDLGMIAMGYGNVYVAQIASGSRDGHTVKAFAEAESYDGPSLIIAYSHCIAHGYNLNYGPAQQKAAVESGHWPLYRFDPRIAEEGKPALQLDSPAPKIKFKQYAEAEVRYRMLMTAAPERSEMLMKAAQKQIDDRRALYEALANGTEAAPDTSN
jgi:pyruvate-ferredoxin/flavodoxin oxidoreductase